MKKLFLITLLIYSAIYYPLNAQGYRYGSSYKGGFEFSAMGGYTIAGSYNGSEGNVDVQSSPSYGGTIGYILPINNTLLEFQYLGTLTKATLRPYSITPSKQIEEIDLSINYFILGATYKYPISNTTELFGNASLGLIYANPSTKYNSMTVFSFSLGGGAKTFFSKNVGIKIQTSLLLPSVFGGGGVYIGTGGIDYGISSYTLYVDWNFSGGLVFRF